MLFYAVSVFRRANLDGACVLIDQRILNRIHRMAELCFLQAHFVVADLCSSALRYQASDNHLLSLCLSFAIVIVF